MKKSRKSIKKEHKEQLASMGRGLMNLRKDKGYTNYHNLAYDMDMVHSQYGAYENGKNLTIITLIKILDFHKISLRDFFNRYFDFKSEFEEL